jgi:hypothetical protein
MNEPNSDVTVISMQSPYPLTFVCYECKDGNHRFCVGVPCHCKYCEAAIKLLRPGEEKR